MKLTKRDGCYQLPDCDHLEGISLLPAPTPKASRVTLQYRNATAGWCKVEMPLLDALYLLNPLEALSAQNGYDALRRPPQENG